MKPIRLAANKYGNVRETEDGYTFDSQAEAKHYRELKYRLLAGEISDLQVHPRFPIRVNGTVICTYVADFAYFEGGMRVVEDVKGVRTAVFVLKAKLLRATWGIEIREVKAK